MRLPVSACPRTCCAVVLTIAAVLACGVVYGQTPAAPVAPATAATPATTTAPAAPAVLSTASASAAPAAAPAAPAEASARAAVSGVTTGNSINVRKGPGTEYPIYFTAPIAYPVKVVGKRADWLEIEFPGQGFSYVDKQFVQKRDDKTGIVTSAGVNVRSGPGTNFDRLYTVPAGQMFQILGVDPTDKWYQVAPMPGETAWINAEYVKLSGPVPASETQVPPAPEVAATTTTTTPGAETTAPTTEVKADPMADKLSQAEQLFKTETAKENPAEWDLKTLETMYSEVEANSTNSVNKELARTRLAQIDAFESVKARASEIGKVGEDLQKKLTDLEKERQEELIRLANVGARETPYSAVGVVEKFYIAGLGGATHKLVNGDSIDFLLKSDVVDLNACNGKKVGLRGSFEIIPGQNVRMINVTQVDDMSGAENTPAQ